MTTQFACFTSTKVQILTSLTWRHQEAIVDFTRVLQIHPKNAHAYFRRAFAYKALGSFDNAANDFETAKAIAPENPLLIVNYLQLYSTPVIELCKAGQEVY